MASILRDGQIRFNDGRILYAETPLTGKDFLELVPLLRQLDPILGRAAMVGFPFVSGGGGGAGLPGPAGPAGPPGAPPSNHVETAHSLYAETSLPDTTPVVPPLIYDGQVVAQIAVPTGRLVITDAFFGLGFVYWTIEVDFGGGGGFVPIASFGFVISLPPVTEIKRFKSPIVIPGGPGVAMRLTATAVAPPFPIDVNATIRLYSEP